VAAAEPILEGGDSTIAGTFEDDYNPYPVPQDPRQREICPNCKQTVPRGTIACNLCGFNRHTGVTARRIHKKLARQWQSGWRIRTRLGIFLAIQSVMLIANMTIDLADGDVVSRLAMWAFGTLLMSFLLGTFPRLELTRSTKGRVRLTKAWRVCFIPWRPVEIDLRGYEGVTVTRFHNSDTADFAVLIFLLLSGIIPGIIWWLCVIYPEQFDVNLTRDHGTPAYLLYRGRNEKMAVAIVASLHDVTNLK